MDSAQKIIELVSSAPIYWALGLLPLCCCLFLIISSRRAGLSGIPGPFIARYTDAYNLYYAWSTNRKGDRVSHYRALQQRYGDVVRTGPKTVTVIDAAAVPVIYGLRSRLNKGPAYSAFAQSSSQASSLLVILDEKTHSQYRKLVSNAYSMTSLKGYEPYVGEMVDHFVEVCDRFSATQEPMNISLWCHFYCFDVVSKVTMGEPIGCLTGKDALGLIEMVKDFRSYASVVSQMPWLHKVLRDNPIFRRTTTSPFIKLVADRVRARLQSPDPEGQRPDLLSHFVATHYSKNELMDLPQVMVSTAGNFIAGGLSPASTFDVLCQFLANHVKAQDKIYEELKEANCSVPALYDEVKDLPYLEGVVREAYRLHQSASPNLQRVTGPSGLTLPNGTHIPAGVQIGCPAGAVNQDPRAFGKDADTYKPERWMQGPGETFESWQERRRVMDRSELAFGHGSRTCIGKSLTALEIFKVVATLMAQFRFELVGQAKRHEVFVRVHRREMKATSN